MPIAIGPSTCLQRGEREANNITLYTLAVPRKRPNQLFYVCYEFELGLTPGIVWHITSQCRDRPSALIFLFLFFCVRRMGRQEEVFERLHLHFLCTVCVHYILYGGGTSQFQNQQPFTRSFFRCLKRQGGAPLSHSSIKSAVRSTSSSIHYLLLTRRVDRETTKSTLPTSGTNSTPQL